MKLVKMEKRAIRILVKFATYLYFEAVKSLLANEQTVSESRQYIVECSPQDGKFIPDIILADFCSLDEKLLSSYPDAKVFLIDTGLEPDVISSMLFSHKIDVLLPCDTDVHFFKKALNEVVNSGSTTSLFRHYSSTKLDYLPDEGHETRMRMHQGVEFQPVAIGGIPKAYR